MTNPACDLPNLYGQTVLIAEPNPLIAMDLAATLTGWGARPLLYYDLDGPAQMAAPSVVGAALIDVPYTHQPLAGLIGALQQRDVPTVLTTAVGASFISDAFPGLHVFDKPVDHAALARWLSAAAQSSGLTLTSRPWSRGNAFAWARGSMAKRFSCHS